MEINFIECTIDKLVECFEEIGDEKGSDKILVLGSIDNNVYCLISKYITDFSKLYIGISKKYTTKKMIESLLSFNNVFFQDNNNYRGMLKENVIIQKKVNFVQITLIPFELREEIIENSNNSIIQIKIFDITNEKFNIANFIEKYQINKFDYLKLNKELFLQLEKNKAFRNEKADTLDEDINKDEIIKSFRTIQSVEDKDEFLKMVEVHSNLKNKEFLKSDIVFCNIEDSKAINMIADFDLDDDEIQFE